MKKNFLFFFLRKFKGFFFLLRLDIFTPKKFFVFLGHLAELSKWINKQKSISFSDFYSFQFNYDKRLDLFNHVIEKENLNTEIDYMEFGVASGSSFRWWVEKNKNANSRFHGFDTFTGLPEDWGPFKKGDMASDNKILSINDSRCKFHRGLFQQTLPGFFQSYQKGKRKIIHMDADLYSATLYVLSSITPYLQNGDIIFFDEFNVPLHEFKAFKEWTDSFYINYEVLGAVNNFYQIAVKVKIIN